MTDSPVPLSGRIACITGASSGIGAAIARRFVQEGAAVVLGARREDRLRQLEKELTALRGRCFVHILDLRDESSIQTFLNAGQQALGGIDILVNNAGLGHHNPLMSGDTERWREMWEVNVLGLSVMTRDVIQHMQSRQLAGHIVHISSMAAHRVPSDSGMYSATKYAVRALTEALRQELWAAESPIRVSQVSPAFVETEFAEKYHDDPGAKQRTYGNYRVLQPDDVAQAVVYAVTQPKDVQVHDVLLRPRRQQT